MWRRGQPLRSVDSGDDGGPRCQQSITCGGSQTSVDNLAAPFRRRLMMVARKGDPDQVRVEHGRVGTRSLAAVADQAGQWASRN